jgi:hypothetical protein
MFTGEDNEVIPLEATRITADASAKVIPAEAFREHINL